MSTWADRYLQPHPNGRLTVERTPVEGATCPRCGSTDVKRYPVATQSGARIATKCQDCLHSLAIDRPTADDWWPPYRSLTYDWKASPAERATRDRV